MAGTVSLYLQDRTLAKLDAAVERCAAEDRAKDLTGREVTNRSRLIERIIEEHLAAEPKLSMEDIRYHVVSLAEEYGAEKASLFGSYARGEASESSDVDLLLEKGAIRGLRVLDFQDEPARRLGENFDEGGVSHETFVR